MFELTTKAMTDKHVFSEKYFIGLGLAIGSSLFIGSSFIIKKLSLIKLAKAGNVRAGAGGFGYLKDWLWWLGFLTMGLGELLNFAAYIFAPASLVTPLGALSVLVSTLLASHFLGETLNILGKIGCLLCIIGSTIIVIHAPKEEEIESLDTLLRMLQEPVFSHYIVIVIIFSILTIWYIGPKYGNQHVWVYVSLCSIIGSVTVMACKGLGVAIREAVRGDATIVTRWTAVLFLATVFFCVGIQMNYLNKSLDLFSTSVVTPVYYVMFTTFVIFASALLFKEWINLSLGDILGTLCGFVIVAVAITLLHVSKDNNTGAKNIYSSEPLIQKNYRNSVFYKV